MGIKKVAIIGSGGFGREVLWLIRDYNAHYMLNSGYEALDVLGFITNDIKMHGKIVCDIPVLKPYDWLLRNLDVYAVCGIGDPRDRIKVTKYFEGKGVKFLSIIHPSVKMSQYVEIGNGCIVCAGNIITTQVKIGNHVHINLNSTIGHDVVIKDFVTVSPGVNISGKVEVGFGAFLGTNSAIIERVKIGKGAVVGAGSVVNKDVEENVVSVGIPSKAVKKISDII
jgi:sugar O-acyltransferase (sialic acid O-acetyltransferase NeuD family)